MWAVVVTEDCVGAGCELVDYWLVCDSVSGDEACYVVGADDSDAYLCDAACDE